MEVDSDADFVHDSTKDVQLVRDVGPEFAPFDKAKNADVILRAARFPCPESYFGRGILNIRRRV